MPMIETGDEWSTGRFGWEHDPEPLIQYLQLHDLVTQRKARLFGSACCRDLPAVLAHPGTRKGIEAAELRADGMIPRRILRERRQKVKRPRSSLNAPWAEGFWAAAGVCADVVRPIHVADFTRFAVAHWGSDEQKAKYAASFQVDLVSEIFGNPFRPVTFAPSWRTSTAVALASQMYESREFGAMPVLADALQDSGCDSEDISEHCRGPGPHVRGCWVVDLVLGKE